MGAHPQVRGALCLLADSLLRVVLLSLWSWPLTTGHGQQPSIEGSAATKLQGADLKGGRKSWVGVGAGGWPTDAETGKGSLAAPDSEAEEQSCLIQCPSNSACVSAREVQYFR